MLRLSVRPGDRLEDAPAFDVHVAGSEANVAYAAARIGLHAAWASVLPDNALGHRVAHTLAAGGVDTSLVRWEKAGLADTQFFHVSGITLALADSSRELALRAMEEAKARGASVTMDVNYRQRLWNREAAADAVREVAPLVDVLVATAEDARDLFGADGVDQLHAALGVETAVLTLGAEGAIAARGGITVRRGGHAVETIDRVGAGDAFVAGLIWGLVDGSLELGLERGLAMSALKMTLHGDLFRLDAGDVAALLANDHREVDR